jgi:putative transposase
LPGWEERRALKASKFSDAQKAFSASSPEGGYQPGDPLQLEAQYDGLLPTEMRRLKQLEDEKSKLRKLVAYLNLE